MRRLGDQLRVQINLLEINAPKALERRMRQTVVKRIPLCLKRVHALEIRKRKCELCEMYDCLGIGEGTKCGGPPRDEFACIIEVLRVDAQVHVLKLQTSKREWQV